jgi:hypothetical protein
MANCRAPLTSLLTPTLRVVARESDEYFSPCLARSVRSSAWRSPRRAGRGLRAGTNRSAGACRSSLFDQGPRVNPGSRLLASPLWWERVGSLLFRRSWHSASAWSCPGFSIRKRAARRPGHPRWKPRWTPSWTPTVDTYPAGRRGCSPTGPEGSEKWLERRVSAALAQADQSR